MKPFRDAAPASMASHTIHEHSAAKSLFDHTGLGCKSRADTVTVRWDSLWKKQFQLSGLRFHTLTYIMKNTLIWMLREINDSPFVGHCNLLR